MIHALLQSLFVQVTVPVVLTQLFAMRMDKKAFAKMNRSMGKLQANLDECFEHVNRRLDGLMLRLDRIA